MDKTQGEIFKSLTSSITCKRTLIQKQVWLPWKDIEPKFGEEEAMMHINNGRIACRPSPKTKGLHENCDMADYETQKEVSKSKKQLRSPEMEECDDGDGPEAKDAFFDQADLNAGSLWSRQQQHLRGQGPGQGHVARPARSGRQGFDGHEGQGQGKGASSTQQGGDGEAAAKKMQLTLIKCSTDLDQALDSFKVSKHYNEQTTTEAKSRWAPWRTA